MRFYLGTHRPNWVWQLNVPLFLSRRTLSRYKTLHPATAPWALDSGGFSELTLFGEWRTPPHVYVGEVKRWRDEIGSLEWAAIQDWMCEPFMLAKTGLTLAEHQRRTVDNYATLLDFDATLPWAPVIQGWMPHDYLDHVEQYDRANLPLRGRIVGVGSVCRRKRAADPLDIVRPLWAAGLRLHAFGVKGAGLALIAPWIESSDSLAWSFAGRRNPPMLGCVHRTCANCPRYALAWRERLLARVGVA